MIIHVDVNRKLNGDGSEEKPFKTIKEATAIANPGDEVLVYPGVYREYVDPKKAGTAEDPIVYRSKEKGKAVITGAEIVNNWEKYDNNVWKVSIQNSTFGDYNPYQTVLFGDWYSTKEKRHTGEIYLNGKSMYEVNELEDVLNPDTHTGSWDPDFSVYTWFTTQEDDQTILYANFQGHNPNEDTVEINVRRNCFFPSEYGIDYITVSGFVIKQAAPTWAPPTAFQDGMIGPNWSKGWIIEDCDISDSKCVGISLGKYLQPNNENKWTLKRMKDGTQTERDAILQAQREGWNKENIGSHTVRRNHIHDCEQAGIVGHLGCVFSRIEDNHIHHINTKQLFVGAEVAGVKLHAAIDVIFKNNHLHHCVRGLWLDWQAQGTRVTQNLFHDNVPPEHVKNVNHPLAVGEDLFVEVSHGPTLIDNNLLLSPQSCRYATQGSAFVHNLFAGSFTSVGEGTDNLFTVEETRAGDEVGAAPRYTPYHVPHKTGVAGFMTFLHGDTRFYNNVFVQHYPEGHLDKFYEPFGFSAQNSTVGLTPFNGFRTQEEYEALFFNEDGTPTEDTAKYYVKLPVYASGNVYFNGAKPWEKEVDYKKDTEQNVELNLVYEEDKPHLETNLQKLLSDIKLSLMTTDYLGEAFEPEQKFENPDGTPITFDRDYFNNKREINPTPGPFERFEDESIQLKD